MQTVINTGFALQGLARHLDSQALNGLLSQIVALANAVANDQENKRAALDERLTNNMQALETNTNVKIGEIRQLVQEAKDAAEILGATELGQVEAILKRMVESPAMQEALNAATVTINGTRYTLNSVLTAVATAEQEAHGELVLSVDGSQVAGYRMSLTDGRMALFDAQVEEDGNTVTATFTSQDFAGTGVPAGFSGVFTKRTAQANAEAFGVTLHVNQHVPTQISHLVVGWAGRLAAADVPGNPVPDANDNGALGS